MHYSSCLFSGRSSIIPNIRLVEVISSCVNLEHKRPRKTELPEIFNFSKFRAPAKLRTRLLREQTSLPTFPRGNKEFAIRDVSPCSEKSLPPSSRYLSFEAEEEESVSKEKEKVGSRRISKLANKRNPDTRFSSIRSAGPRFVPRIDTLRAKNPRGRIQRVFRAIPSEFRAILAVSVRSSARFSNEIGS